MDVYVKQNIWNLFNLHLIERVQLEMFSLRKQKLLRNLTFFQSKVKIFKEITRKKKRFFELSLRKVTLRSAIPYPFLSVIWNTSKLLIKAAKRDKLCLPEPPTPTNKAYPRGLSKIRLIRQLQINAKGDKSLN